MNQRESRLLPPLARAIKAHLKESGMSMRQLSLETGHGPGWLSELLNPKRSPTLTISGIEEIAEAIGVDPFDLLKSAFPPDQSQDAFALLNSILPTGPNGRISHTIASQIEEILNRPVNVKAVSSSIDLDLIESIADYVWLDRTTAYEYAAFHVDELFSRPRKVHTLTMALALLSEILRTKRTSDTFYRSQLLIRAYHLWREYPNPKVKAYIDERTAYLVWNILADPGASSRILESPEIFAHPLKVRLFTARANFHHVLGDNAVALEYLNFASNINSPPGEDPNSSSPILTSLIQNMTACAHLHRQELEDAEAAISGALSVPGIPDDVRFNNLAVLAKIRLTGGNAEQAALILTDLINSTYSTRWPDKAAYVALDLFDASAQITYKYTRETISSLISLQSRLLQDHPVESELKLALQRGIAAASSTVTNAIQRALGDPNG